MACHIKKSLPAFVGLLLLFTSSCDMLWPDQLPQYWYKVQNNSSKTLNVFLEPDPTHASGSQSLQWSVAPGASMNVWGASGSEEDGSVFDFERLQTRMTYFKSFSIHQKDLVRSPFFFFNDPKDWHYQKNSAYEATYTLTISETDLK